MIRKLVTKIIISLAVVGGAFFIAFLIFKKNPSSKPESRFNTNPNNSLPETDNSLPSHKKQKDGSLDKSLPITNQTSAPSKEDKEKNEKLEFVSTKIDDNTFRYHFQQGEENRIPFAGLICLLRIKDQKIFSLFQNALKDANAKLEAYFWECPPATRATIADKDFEFTVIKSKALNDMKQDYSSFSEYIVKDAEKAEIHSHSFSSLGKDGILVIPGLRTAADKTELDYKNISQFTQNAPLEQQQNFWKEVAEELFKELQKKDGPRWLSTHGLGRGTSYLHVRIYDNPKYYHHTAYKNKG